MKILEVTNCRLKNNTRTLRSNAVLSQKHIVRLVYHEEEPDAPVRRTDTLVPIKLATKRWSSHPAVQVVKYAEMLLRQWAEIIRFKPDLLYCHDIDTLPLAWIGCKMGIPFLYDSHEYWRGTMHHTQRNARLYRLLVWVENAIIRRAKGVIAVNEELAEKMRADHHITLPTVVRNVPGDISITPGDYLRAVLPVPADGKIVLYVGGLTTGRGLKTIIHSVKVWDANIYLAMMGYGFLQPELERRVKELGLNDRVFFVPAVPPADVLSWTSSADVGIVPIENLCESYYYCLPNKLFECVLAGLPVLSSNFPVIGSIVREYNLGYTFDPADELDIADKVNRIVREGFAVAPEDFERFKHDFSWDIDRQKMLALLDEVVSHLSHKE